MKNFKKMMALALAMVMVIAMALPAMAADTTGAPTSGSITINSPIVGATYKVYKIFDMTTNKDVDAFSYTINENSKFYGAVVDYMNKADSGLTLSRVQNSSPATYNVSVDESKFDAQAFGKAMQAVLATGSPAVSKDAAETATAGTGIVEKAAGGAAISEDYSKVCTITEDNTSDQLVFDGTDHAGIPLGYFLINPTYPQTAAKTVTMGSGAAAQTFTDDDFVKDEDGKVVEPRALTQAAKDKIAAYAEATVDDTYVNNYIKDHGITTNKDGSPLSDDETNGRPAYKKDLIDSMKADAEKKILAAFNGENGAESDINVKEPILVFLDSSKPDAVINEKNELDKWDVPVNPEGEAKPGTPEHGEPEGGKNIIAGETKTGDTIYADWSDAEIGESVHYQLRVNAMNFIRTGETDDTVEQVKEYILADFQSAHMHFDESKGLHVSIWQGDNANNSQAAGTAKSNVTSSVGVGTDTGIAGATYEANGSVEGVTYPSINYTNYAKDPTNNFFKNDTEADGTLDSLNGDIFGTTKKGIVVPWVIVSEDESLKSTYPIYTITNVPKKDANNNFVYKTETVKTDANGKVPFLIQDATNPEQWQQLTGVYVSTENHAVDADGKVIDTDANGNLKTNTDGSFVYVKDTKPVYTYSIYNSDVTIVVDYWMILDDDAIVDEPGNKNFAQYGWNPIDDEDTEGNPKAPEEPKDTDEPSKKEEIDEATVYTYALAWVKTDEQGVELADAEFELPFYVKKDKKDGKSYIYAMTKDEYDALEDADKATKYTNKVTTTTAADDGQKGVITIKGMEQGKYTITETQAPAGYNKLTAPFELEAKKSGVGVTTKTKTTIFLDAQGNVTDKVTNVTKEYITDEDSYNKATPAVQGEETSVPVYQFKNIVNKQGSELPSTGGIGTTIFYVIGAILVLGAGILLVTRRRMNAN